ncbi:hypothetical protein E2C01_090726 [Portunus trituberculatus]|uniref:Uncharacterized protein n=1 Tax=Portunus trituberculatus TaxID=210409 RepID=A0A5B7JFH9_PORTR|nr:hypothetical protein [Portunus trituberculatus]
MCELTYSCYTQPSKLYWSAHRRQSSVSKVHPIPRRQELRRHPPTYPSDHSHSRRPLFTRPAHPSRHVILLPRHARRSNVHHPYTLKGY